MDVQAPLYQMFCVSQSAAQARMDTLVSALWKRLFPGQDFGQNHRLNRVFGMISHSPEWATLQLCPYYFDQVTYNLPTRNQVKHRESCNLRLHWFNSWANPEQEHHRMARKVRQHLNPYGDVRPTTGMHLSQLWQLQEYQASKTISTDHYVFMMYGHRL